VRRKPETPSCLRWVFLSAADTVQHWTLAPQKHLPLTNNKPCQGALPQLGHNLRFIACFAPEEYQSSPFQHAERIIKLFTIIQLLLEHKAVGTSSFEMPEVNSLSENYGRRVDGGRFTSTLPKTLHLAELRRCAAP